MRAIHPVHGLVVGSFLLFVIAGCGEPEELDDASVTPLWTVVVDVADALPDAPHVSRTADIRIDPAVLDDDVVVASLFDGETVVLVRERLERRGPDDYTWFGRPQGTPEGHVVLVVRSGQVTGNLAWSGQQLQIRPAPGGGHHLIQVDPSAFPPEAEPVPVEGEPMAGEAPVPMADSATRIDVLVVYTPDAATASQDIEAEIQLAVDETNLSYANSGIEHRLRLADAREVTYTETADGSQDLGRLQDDSDGEMDVVHDWRDEVRADVVVLIAEDIGPGTCGIGFLMQAPDASFADSAFSVVQRGCATGQYSFGHEIGHNLGADHDRYVTQGTGAHDYSHGFVRVGDWRTVMAYANECTDQGLSCVRVPYWSNPDVDYQGQATGIDAADPDGADNRLTLNQTAAVVAQFRDALPTVPDVTADGWYAGDGHVHTRLSGLDAAYFPLIGCDPPTAEQQLSAAERAGFSWVFITDHEDMLREHDPDLDPGAVWIEQNGILVPDALDAVIQDLPDGLLEQAEAGEELGSSLLPGFIDDLFGTQSMNLGHFLGYGMTDYVTWDEEWVVPPDGLYPSATAMMEDVYDDGFGAVAHPGDWKNPWQAWTELEDFSAATPVGFEIINGDDASNQDLQQWQDYVHSGRLLRATANSDAHCVDQLGSATTYVRLLPGEALTTGTILDAMADGRMVASQGPFLRFSLHNPTTGELAEIGDTLVADAGETLSLTLEWSSHEGDDPDDTDAFGEIAEVRVFDRSHRYSRWPLLSTPVPFDEPLDADHGVSGTTGSVARDYVAESSGAIWVLAESANGQRIVANPIFLDVPGSAFTGTQVDTALIIDSSGSMDDTDPADHRLQAAKFYVDLAQPGDYIAVIDFDGDAWAPGPLQEAVQNRQALKDAVDTINSSGGTDISDGMQEGYQQLASSGSDNVKIAILLTDGQGSYNQEADDFAAEGWPVYTIGLSQDADATLLQEIADVTGGTFTLVETEDAAQAALEQIYRDIATDVSGLSELLADALELLLGEQAEWVFDVTEDMDLLRASITWPGSEFDLRLIAPDGTVVDEDVTDPDITFAAGETYAVYTVAHPQAGEWTAEVTAVDVDPAGEVVSLTVAANTSTMPTILFTAPDAGVELAGSVLISAEAFDLEGVVSIEIGLDDTSLAEMDGDIADHTWDTTAVADGIHTLWATVRDVDGNTAVASRQVQVLNDPDSVPAIDAGGDTTAEAGVPLTLTAHPLNAAAVDAAILWDLGDGAHESGGEVEYVYAEPDDYTIICYATRESGVTGYDTLTVTVLDPADVDHDGDGVTPNQGDCDDADGDVFPGAAEVCDGFDQDCDGQTDEGFDGDGDGFLSATLCGAFGDDCDDADPALNPADTDGDGWSTCDADCDDTDATVSPADADGDGTSACDGDCDDSDPQLTVDDLDGDGFSSCDGDCLDTDLATHPAADEWCDGRDNDCDGQLDEDAVDAATWYADGDGDGFGDAEDVGVLSCDEPAGHAPNALDCDDADPSLDAADTDGDGFSTCDGDCDDLDASLDPGDTDQDGTNSCGGDCDDLNNTLTVDDADSDGASSCEGDCDDLDPAMNLHDLDQDGFSTCAGDCDDGDDGAFPGNNEFCNVYGLHVVFVPGVSAGYSF